MARAYWVRGNRCEPEARPVNKGMTLSDIVMEYNPETGEWHAPTICLINNAPVLRGPQNSIWKSTCVEESDVVTFIELPRGGGKGGSNPLQILFTVVMMVVAYVVPPLMGLTGAMANFVTGAILAVGSLVAGAIFKAKAVDGPAGADQEQADPTYSISGGNRARLFQVIGEGFGRMRVVPDVVANAWAYYIGNDQYYYTVLGLGQGEYDVESMSFGDTAFWRKNEGLVSGYEVELQFVTPGKPVTLFPDNVDTSIEVSGQEVFHPNHPQFAGYLGPYSANSPGTKTDRIVNNIVFPQGVGVYDDEGNLRARGVTVDIHYQAIDDNDVPIGPWLTLVTRTWTLRTLTPQRFSVDIAVPAGRYQVRLRRLDHVIIKDGVPSGQDSSRMGWESLFSFLPGTLQYNQSTVALRIKASNVITQQAASSISVIYTRKLPLYDLRTKTWSQPTPTRKVSAAISWVLKTEWGGRLSDNSIDLETLWGPIDEILTIKGWTLDGYFSNSYTVWPLLLEICQPLRIVPRIINGAVTFVFDQPGRPVRHVFTAHDVIRGSLSITYNTFSENTPDDIMWSYLDENVGFQTREVRCALPDSENRLPAIKSPIGCVNRDQAHKMGIFQAACNRKRRIVAKFNCEGIGRLLLMGDVCALNHPYFSGYASGAIAWWDEDQLMLDLGNELELAHPGNYYITLNRPDGTPWGPCKISYVEGMEVFLDYEDYQILLSQGQGNPFNWVDFGQGRAPTIWTVQEGQEISRRMIITSVVPLDPWRHEITCINDDPTVDEFENMPTPIWDFRGQTGGTFIPLTAPTNINAVGLGDSSAPIIRLTWLSVANAAGYRVEQNLGGTDWGLAVNVSANVAEIPVAPGALLLRVAGRDTEGRVGAWARWTGHTDQLFYPAPTLVGTFESAEAVLTWGPPPEAAGAAAPVAWDLFIIAADGFSVMREVELHPDLRSFTYTLQMVLADGGPFRYINFSLNYRTVQNNKSDAAELTLVALPPRLIDATYAVEATNVTVQSIVASNDHTGIIIARGASSTFSINDAIELRSSDNLPFIWSGLASNTRYYFRIAAKDSFFDATQIASDLLWSDVISVDTLGV